MAQVILKIAMSALILLVHFFIIYSSYQTIFGWDTLVYFEAQKVYFENYSDPYLLSNFKMVELSYVYLPVYLYLLKLLSCFSDFKLAGLVFSYLALFSSLIIWVKSFDILRWFYLHLILLFAFSAWKQLVDAGNITALELLLLSFALFFVEKKQYNYSAVFMGLMFSIKLLLAPLLLVFFALPLSFKSRLKIFGISCSAFALPFALSACIDFEIFISFFKAILGLYPQHSPIHENYDYGLFSYLYGVSLSQFLTSGRIPMLYLLILSWVAVSIYWVKKKAKEISSLEFISFLLLSGFVVAPRLKIYTLVLAAFVYALIALKQKRLIWVSLLSAISLIALVPFKNRSIIILSLVLCHVFAMFSFLMTKKVQAGENS